MIALALACGIVTLIIVAILAVGSYPRLYCALFGHDPKMEIMGYNMHWFCQHCRRECGEE